MKKIALLSAVAIALAAGSIVPTVAFAAPKHVMKKPAHMMKHSGKKMAMPMKASGPRPAAEATTDQLNQQQLDQSKTK